MVSLIRDRKSLRFYSVHYQDEFRVEMGVKISEIYHGNYIFLFGARPFSLGGARMEKPYKNSKKIIEDATFARILLPSSF